MANEVRVPEDCKTLQEAVDRVHENARFTTIIVGQGTHLCIAEYIVIPSAMRIVGDPDVSKEDIVIGAGIFFMEGIGMCHLQHLTVRRAKKYGVLGQSSFTMEDVLVEWCRSLGVFAHGTGVVCRFTDVEVRHCKGSGVLASQGASITLIGGNTKVHHNCTDGKNYDCGLLVYGPSSTIQLVSPLTKEQVAIDNGGDGNWGARGNGADINQIKTTDELAEAAAAAARGEVRVPEDCKTLQDAVEKLHQDRRRRDTNVDNRLTTIVVGRGEHQIKGKYLWIYSAMNIVGVPGVTKEEIVIKGGIWLADAIQGDCHLQHLTLCQSRNEGVYGQSSFTMDDVLVEQCDSYGVIADGTGVVCRCTNVEVRRCGLSGVCAFDGASITLIGAKTTVHHNCTQGGSDEYGLRVFGSYSSTIRLVSPLTKEQVSVDNVGGGNCGADDDGDIDQIKTITQAEMEAAAAAAARGEVRVPEDCKTLNEAVDQVHEDRRRRDTNVDNRLTTIVVGAGEHVMAKYKYGEGSEMNDLEIPSAMRIVGDPGVPKEDIVVMGGIKFMEGIGMCHLEHLTVRQAKSDGVFGKSSFTMEDVLVEQCGANGVFASGRGVVAQCTNVEVKECGKSGVLVATGASITLAGAKTTVHDNCTKEDEDDYGMAVDVSSSIHFIDPLTKDQVFFDNGVNNDHNFEDHTTRQKSTREQKRFALQLLSSDTCKAKDILEYKPTEALTEGTSTNHGMNTDYVFKHKIEGGIRTFTIRYYSQYKTARVIKIEDKDVIQYEYNNANREDSGISGVWDDDTVEINQVYMGSAKGCGYCTNSVGYMLKVLIDEAALQRKFPYTGKVHILSDMPCAAVNCYCHAFMKNGFEPNTSEINEFIVHLQTVKRKEQFFKKKSIGFESTDFMFEEFKSTKQMQNRLDANKRKATEYPSEEPPPHKHTKSARYNDNMGTINNQIKRLRFL